MTSDVLYRMEARLTDSTLVGVLREGLRVDNGFVGTITAGALAGATVKGIDYYLIRPDGVGVIDAREVILTPDGRSVAARAQGFVTPPAGMPVPPLEVLLSADFAWPDVEFAITVAQTFTTAAPDLEHLNSTLVSHLGWVNYATRRLLVDARVLAASLPEPDLVAASRG